MDESQGIELPHNIEAEQALLAGALLFPDVLSKLASTQLKAGDFYRIPHGKLWQSMTEMHNSGKLVDIVTLSDYLETSRIIADIGGRDYLASLMDCAPFGGAGSIDHYLEIILHASTRRRLVDYARQCMDIALNEPDPEALVSRAAQELEKIQSRSCVDYAPIRDSMATVLDKATTDDPADILYTGIRALDNRMHGIPPQSLIILGGDASAGKTAMAMQWSLKWAEEQKRIGWISIEMDGESLARRIYVEKQGIPIHKLWSKQLSELEVQMMVRSINDDAYSHIFVDSRSDVTDANIVSRVRDMHNRTGADVIVIDHLHLIQIRGKADNAIRLGMDSITSALKKLKKDLDIRIILLAQLSRGGQFKESQGIDAGGDINIKLTRPELGQPEVKCTLAKQRDGATGDIELYFAPYGFYSTWGDMEREMQSKSLVNC